MCAYAYVFVARLAAQHADFERLKDTIKAFYSSDPSLGFFLSERDGEKERERQKIMINQIYFIVFLLKLTFRIILKRVDLNGIVGEDN